MRQEHVGEIRISSRVLRIGHQAYPLANISRVQTLRLVRRGRHATWHPLGEIIVLPLAVAAFVVLATTVLPELRVDAGFDLDGAARALAAVVTAVAAIRVTYLVCLLCYRLLFRKQQYALVIETAGTQTAALSGTDPDEVHRIEHRIVQAIENPPRHEQVIQVKGDLVVGNKVGHTLGRGASVGGSLGDAVGGNKSW